MANYSPNGVDLSTPFGDFTKWFCLTHALEMAGLTLKERRAQLKARRIKKLREWIDKHFDGVVANAARAYNPNDPKPQYFNDLLAGRKSFAEKAAEQIEEKLGIPFGFLSDSESCEWPFKFISPDRWNKLEMGEKNMVEGAALTVLLDIERNRPSNVIQLHPNGGSDLQ